MRMKLAWSHAALSDLEQIWQYFADYSLSVADQRIDRIKATTDLLRTTPMIGRRRPEIKIDLRSLVKDDFLILYRVRMDERNVRIVRVLHQRQDIAALFTAD